MRHCYTLCLFQLWAVTCLFSQPSSVPPVRTAVSLSANGPARADSKTGMTALPWYGSLPLSFEANHGQIDSRVKFMSRMGRCTLFLTSDEAVLTLVGRSLNRPSVEESKSDSYPLRGFTLRMKLRNPSLSTKVEGLNELAGKSSYFLGNDPARWRVNIPTYTKVKYEEVYPGVDLVYYGNQRQLEYDFVVSPGANPRRIGFDIVGAKSVRRDGHGDLVMKVGDGEIRWPKPLVYQEKNGIQKSIASQYIVAHANRVGFEVGKYDIDKPLYIDPLVYSTYLGGSGSDEGQSVAVDGSGNAYVAGVTTSTDFPLTPGAFQSTYIAGYYNVFVAKLNASGSALLYSTYIGGSSMLINGYSGNIGIAIDGMGNAYLTGGTASTDFPTTPNALQRSCGNLSSCGNAFVTKVDPTGSSLIYSTYLGGSGNDGGSAVAVDSAGDLYVTGIASSTDFPVTQGAFQRAYGGGASDAFLTEINPGGTALVYSTYLGGTANDVGAGVALDGDGNAYVAGTTSSTDFPVTPNAFQTLCNGGINECQVAFVSKLNASGLGLAYSTYLGYTTSQATGIAVNGAGNAYVTGVTNAIDFPTTSGAFQTSCGSPYPKCENVFVTKMNLAGSGLVYSTYLGGRTKGLPNSGFATIAVDNADTAYVTGATYSTSFPTTPGAFQTHCHNSCNVNPDAFVTRFNSSGSTLLYSTYLGGKSGKNDAFAIAQDGTGNAYITGFTSSTGFPVTPGAFQNACGNLNSCGNAFVTKIPVLAVTATQLSSSPNPSTYGEAVTFTAVVGSSAGVPPDGEAIMFMKGKTLLGSGTLNGGSTSFTTSTLKVGTSTVKAVYGGDSTFAGSTSKAVKQVVKKTGD